jgi:catechol-2,3-dioxygenase
MIKGVSGAKIWTEDISNLLPFYREILGLEATVERPDFVVFGHTTGASLALGTHSEVKGRNGARRAIWSTSRPMTFRPTTAC